MEERLTFDGQRVQVSIGTAGREHRGPIPFISKYWEVMAGRQSQWEA